MTDATQDGPTLDWLDEQVSIIDGTLVFREDDGETRVFRVDVREAFQ